MINWKIYNYPKENKEVDINIWENEDMLDNVNKIKSKSQSNLNLKNNINLETIMKKVKNKNCIERHVINELKNFKFNQIKTDRQPLKKIIIKKKRKNCKSL